VRAVCSEIEWMMGTTRVVAACAAAWCVAGASAASAADSCNKRIARGNVVACVLAASVSLRREQLGVEVMSAREQAASPLLPSNPQLVLSAAQRHTAQQNAGNWNANLSQELEIAGQRSARVSAAQASLSAQRSTVRASEREVAADAWRVYFEALAARDAQLTAAKLEQAFAGGGRAAAAGAAQGLVSGIDAELAELTLVRLTQARIAAQARERQAVALLASLLGLDPRSSQLELEGELTPLAPDLTVTPDALDAAVVRRPELSRARETGRAHSFDATALRRSRVPNVTLSIFAQQDGFSERVLGAGIALPIPLPTPIGRTFAGEIAASEALAQQAEAAASGVRRQARLELVTALQGYEAAQAQNALYTADRIADAERSLTSLAQEIHAGRISVSSAVVAQQTLIEFLRARIEAQLELCLASVEVVRAAGLDLNGAQP
jgi:cobalt-zinc-cadmium efflux system outer membrane protein